MKDVLIKVDNLELRGLLEIPKGATKCVLFAHGSGSGRLSSRNQFVAHHLNSGGVATLLMDLLTEEEEKIDELTRELRFNIALLAARLSKVTEWIKKQDNTKNLTIGYFGASTGAAAALIAAAKHPEVAAVVSRGGRPDLAASKLPEVAARTLFLVGGNDYGVIELNEQAFEMLNSEKQFTIIPGATHLFEEKGALEQVAELALQWFLINHELVP